MARAYVFPGQGSQAVGMGQDLADAFPLAREVFEEIDDALGQKLSQLIWDGPEDDLRLTANTQPALMAHSVAAMRVLEKEAGADVSKAAFVAGHSLGEYSALCAAGAISLSETARLLRIRGEAMQAAVPVGEGAMAAILGLDLEKVAGVLAGVEGTVEIANDNCPGQVVISGATAAVEAASAALKEAGAKRAVPLPVSAPFHSSLMQPAAERMAEALQDASISAPAAPVMANVTAAPTSDPAEIRNLLVKQVTGRVRWTESVRAMLAAGVDQFVEVGTGKVLSGLIKKVERDVVVANVGSPADIEAFSKL
ncbi:MAG: ACP S-malonyltransferase [Pseudomonadota bacterium]